MPIINESIVDAALILFGEFGYGYGAEEAGVVA